MAATWSEKVTTLRDFRARNQATLFGLRIASRGLGLLSRFHGGPDVDVAEALGAATSAEPAFTEAFRDAVMHQFRGDPELQERIQNTLTRTIAGDGGALPDVPGIDFVESQDARQRNAAQSQEAAKAGGSALSSTQLEEMVDL